VHRDEDLLGGVLVLDERDEAQRRLALLTDELEPEGSAEKLGPRDVLGLAGRLLQLFRGGGLCRGLGHDLAAEAHVSIVEDAQPVVGQRGTQDVPAQPFATGLVVGGDARDGL
jgi:hypothetical protein